MVSDGVVRSASLVSSRRADAPRVFEGRALHEGLRMLPRLFALCGWAQSIAAARAVEAGSEGTIADVHEAARGLILAAERIETHVRAVHLEGPDVVEPEVEPYLAARLATTKLAGALYPAGDGARPGGGRLEPDEEALERARSELMDRGRAAAALLEDWGAEVLRRGWAALGQADAPVDLDMGRIAGQLRAAPAFAARPVWEGEPVEVGPLAQYRSHVGLRPVIEAHGPGFLARIHARRWALLQDVAALGVPARSVSAARPGPVPRPSGSGVGAANTARGPLIHDVTWEQGLVRRWLRVAPTEWNLHPEGIVTRAPRGWPSAEAQARGRWLLTLLDPCVPRTVNVARAR